MNEVLKDKNYKFKSSGLEVKGLYDTSLRRYVEILTLASNGSLPANIELETLRHRPIKELIDSGLLSFYESTYIEYDTLKVLAVTPEGAIALVNWKKILRETSVGYKIFGSLSKLFWILVGVVCATAPKFVDWQWPL